MKLHKFKGVFGPLSTYCRWRTFSTTNLTPKSTKSQRSNNWEGIIGLEIHAQINADAKLFSGAGTQFAAPINAQVSPFDAALPGTLPVINKRCVEAGVLTALALSCEINLVSKFDRKHYFYADLPAGYQITQQRQPLAKNGMLPYMILQPHISNIPVHKEARIIQVQLEQDSGKSLHDEEESCSLIDLNRAGMGLMEIVTAPDFRSGVEAAAFVKELQLILETLGTCKGVMAEGNMRVDANISVHKPGEELGVRSEVKNLNSIRCVTRAIEFEIHRHISLLEAGKEVVNETRTYDVDTGQTIAMRDKEKIQDYRFMPEPNLPPLRLHTNRTLPPQQSCDQLVNVDTLTDRMPPLPAAVRQRLQDQYGLMADHAYILVNRELVPMFEEVVKKKSREPRLVAHIMVTELLGLLNLDDTPVSECKITPKVMGEVVDMVAADTISKTYAGKVLESLFNGQGQSPEDIVKENGWYQITDQERINAMCQQIINQEAKKVRRYYRGKKDAFGRLVSNVMQLSDGKAKAPLVIATLKDMLEKNRPVES